MRRLRLLTALPLILLAIIVLVIGLQRGVWRPAERQPEIPFGDMLAADGRFKDAIAWYSLLAKGGDETAQRALARVSDLADEPGVHAIALQHLVRAGHATFEEHMEAARALAAAGGLRDALGVLYNAEQRFPDRMDVRFLSFYAAVALDAKRPEVALPLAQRLWQRSGAAQIMAIMTVLAPPRP